MKLRVEIVHTFEIECDDRVDEQAMRWAVLRCTDCCDGREPFSFELSQFGAWKVVQGVAACLRSSVADRISARYPGARQKSWLIEQRIPEFAIRSIHHERRHADGEYASTAVRIIKR